MALLSVGLRLDFSVGLLLPLMGWPAKRAARVGDVSRLGHVIGLRDSQAKQTPMRRSS